MGSQNRKTKPQSRNLLNEASIIYLLSSLIPLLALVYILRDVVNSESVDSVQTTIIIAGVLILSLLGYKILRGVFSSIVESRTVLQKMAQGDLTVQIKEPSKDEVGEVGKSLTEVASILKQKMQEIDMHEKQIREVNLQIARRIDSLVSLLEITNKLGSTYDLGKIATEVLNHIEENMEVEKSMLIYTGSDGKGKLIGIKGFDVSALDEDTSLKIALLALEFLSIVSNNGKVKILNSGTDELDSITSIKKRIGLTNVMVASISKRDNNRIGFIVLGNNSAEKPYTNSDMELLTLLAGQSAIIMENAELYLKTEYSAITDGMTGLYNYRYFRQKLLEEIDRSKRKNHKFSLILLDLDHFKMINDTYGHQTGDLVLKEFARTLRKNVRSMDIVSRYGGDEFVVILPELDLRSKPERAELIRKGTEEMKKVFEQHIEGNMATASLGVSVFPDDGDSIDDLCLSADKALHKAKETGRNRVCLQYEQRPEAQGFQVSDPIKRAVST